MPSVVRSVLNDGYGGPAFEDWSAGKALAILSRDGLDRRVPDLAARAAAALGNDAEAVAKHLTIVGASMAGSREFGSAASWLAQVQRLTVDIATDILISSCDDWQKANRFLPTVAEIRAIAEPRMKRRRQAAARLAAMAKYLEDGLEIPALLPAAPAGPRPPNGPLTDEQVAEWNAIMAKAGALTRYRPDGSRYEVAKDSETPVQPGPRRNPTYADYVALGVPDEVLRTMYVEAEQG